MRHGAPEPVWMNLDYSPVLDESGRPGGVIAIVVETTAKVKAERALRESEAQFRSFAQAVPNHVWTARPDGLLDWFNERVLEYSGASADQLAGQGWAMLVHSDDLAGVAERWAQAVSGGTVYETEFRLRRADGAFRWHLVRALPIKGESGEVLRWVGTNTDIEEQKAAAAALAHLNATLEQQVAQRTADRDRMWRLSTDIMLVVRLQREDHRRQSGLVRRVRLVRSRSLGPRLHGSGPSRRSGRHPGRGRPPGRGQDDAALREPISGQGRLLPPVVLDGRSRGRPHPRGRARHHGGARRHPRARPDLGHFSDREGGGRPRRNDPRPSTRAGPAFSAGPGRTASGSPSRRS